ncbi:MAG: RsfS/YbeB/iojap family protein, partial [Candidatus Methylomirabilis sp.]|nr:RsfS/YbeB/iojap family protein [Deltaproteobacteria bacterium]
MARSRSHRYARNRPPDRRAGLREKAYDIVILDVRKVIDYADFLVIATGTSQPQVRAIA